jgi:ferredoxin
MARRVPLFGKFVDHHLFRGDDIVYLPKDRVVQIHQPVAAPEQMVLPSDVVGHFVDQARHLWIMNTCFCREADSCTDYPIDLGCLFMGEAVLGINPRLGHLATREEAHAHLARAREAGLVHMVGRNRIDNVWMGVGPSGKLLTVCNCCPCCCLWRVLPSLPAGISQNVTRMPGVSVEVTDRCVGCGACTQDVCFVDAIRVVEGRAEISAACRGCGRCVEICPHHAIEMTMPDASSVGATIDRLEPLVDLS